MLWFTDWEFCRKIQCRENRPVFPLPDRFSASQLLARSKESAMTLLAMRSILLQEDPGRQLCAMSDDSVLEQMADLLMRGILHLHSLPQRGDVQAADNRQGGAVAAPGSSPPAPAPASPPRVVREKNQSTRAAAAASSVAEGAGPPVSPALAAPERAVTWIEIELIGEDGSPIPGETYAIQLPNGKTLRGSLDAKGFARVDNIDTPGDCLVSFPKLDKDAFEFLEAAAPSGAAATG